MSPYITTNVALIGVARSGKTTFLTSLLWHLDQYKHDETFQVTDSKSEPSRVTLSKIRINAGGHTDHTYKFREAINKMIRERAFPSKSTDWKECTVEFVRSDWPISRQRINFFDFPGERVADLSLMIGRSYQQWCDILFAKLTETHTVSGLLEDYNKAISSANNEIDCLLAYKDLIGKLVHRHGSLISPSTLLLDASGKHFREKFDGESNLHQQFIDTALSGLPESQFVPIFKGTNSFTKLFEQRYNQYREQVLYPLIRKLWNTDKLLIFIDIPSLLQAGDIAYNDAVNAATQLATILDPSESWVQWLLGWSLLRRVLGMEWQPLKQIIFVASQADRVRPEDISNSRLQDLLEHIVGNIKTKIVLPQGCQTTCCSAIWSSQSANVPDELPSAIPDQWPPPHFKFPYIAGNIPTAITKPPKHKNLDTLFSLIINEKST